ncbi:MAG: L,D-transpeptidase [Bdellovibrionales bacterium]|nr:L,D-transpeptidase [Bdellovibrionales bacterium]
MEVRVYKSAKILELWLNDKLIQTYPIGIGKEEFGHKMFEGDLRTPEGQYKICVKNPKSKFHLSLGLNYPNEQDARKAFKEARISEDDYNCIMDAHRKGEGPPWNTPIGGAIYLHGDLESKNWSEGCIRMYKEDIEYLYQTLKLGDEVFIFP